MWGPQTKQPVHLKSSHGVQTVTNSKSVMARWNKYLQKFLNVPVDKDPDSLENIQQRSANSALGDKPQSDQVTEIWQSTRCGEGIRGSKFVQQTAQMDHQNMGKRPCTTIQERCQHRDHPQKRRSNRMWYLPRYIYSFRSHISPEVMPEIQCGFRSNQSTVDMIFCPQQLQKKCIEQDRPLHIVFIDFTKAFDTVGRTGLWQWLRKYGCPEKFKTMIGSMHTGMMVNVKNGGEVSDTFSITNGVKPGVYWLPRFSISFYQQWSKRFLETFNHARMQISLQLHTSERRQKSQIYL